MSDVSWNRGGVVADPYYGHLKNHLISSTGLSFYNDRDEHLAELISRRLLTLGLRDCFSYSQLLADGNAGGAELNAMIAQLTIGETYFFRDREQFDAIRDVVLPEIIERKKSQKRLRIWSAGCSIGAEPYSIAILLGRDFAARTAGWQISILGTDINREALAAAAEGKFREWALRSTSNELRSECFSSENDVWTIHPEYQRLVSFRTLNLVEDKFPANDIADFDLILCRNVMIYFAPEMIQRLVSRFGESLADHGWFMVGAVEHNMDVFRSFRTVDVKGATLYRKSAADFQQPDLIHRAPAFRSAFALPAPTPRAELERPDLDGLRRLTSEGEWKAAIRYCHTLLTHERLNPVLHFHLAIALEQAGQAGDAERSLRHAIYLDRSFALAHFHLGLALKKKGSLHHARRSLENVLKLLSVLDAKSVVVAGNGLTVAGLKEMTRVQLDGWGGL